MDLTNIFSLWKNAVMNPKETFVKEKANASVGIGILYYFIAFLISGLLGMLGLFINIGTAITVTGAGVVIGAAIVGSILTIIGQGILFIIAKLLGGKGTIIQQYYLVALYAAPLTILSSVISLIPLVGLLSLLIGLYELYLLLLVLTEVHQYGMGKAALTVFLPAIIILILLVIILGVAVISILGAVSSGSTSGLVGLI